MSVLAWAAVEGSESVVAFLLTYHKSELLEARQRAASYKVIWDVPVLAQAVQAGQIGVVKQLLDPHSAHREVDFS
jgi:hypothetical protein